MTTDECGPTLEQLANPDSPARKLSPHHEAAHQAIRRLTGNDMTTENVYMNLLRNQIRDLAEQNIQRANEIEELRKELEKMKAITNGIVGD